jgi:nitrogen fixation protein FixH
MSMLAERPRRSLIPLAFVGAFAVVISANATLIFYAIRSAPALVTDKAYEEGRAYNRELAAAARQEALGWSATLDFAPAAGHAAELAVRIVDRAGAPLGGLEVAARAVRPVGSDAPLDLRLAETAPGRYAATLTLPAPGQWQVEFVARRGEDEFAIAQRVSAR